MPQTELSRKQASWAHYVANAHNLKEPEFRKRAEDACRWFMERARQNVETIVARLKKSGYRFVTPKRAHLPPTEKGNEQIRKLEAKGVYLPISLRMWFEIVGTVDWMGTHPDWPHPGYLFKYDLPEGSPVWFTEPLVVEGAEDFFDRRVDWERDRKDGHDPNPFLADFAPDDLHKMNISGGAPLGMSVDRPEVDGLVLNERTCVGFVAYLRHVFRWGGFPGFETISEAPKEFLAGLNKDLLPL